LITYFWQIEFPRIDTLLLLVSFFGSGILIFIIGFQVSNFFFKYKTDDNALLGLSACFGNSVALGIPLMHSLLGKYSVMPYMILVLFHGLVHFTYTTLIIETYRNRSLNLSKKIVSTITGLFKNIVLVGIFIGIFLNYTKITQPKILMNILNNVSDFALPCVLLSLGISLAKFNLILSFKKSIIFTVLKNILHPLLGYIIAKHIFNLEDLLVITITIASALPSGSQTFYFAYRYNAQKDLISSNIVLSTFVSFFTLSILIIFFNIK
jgi:predicted permease